MEYRRVVIKLSGEALLGERSSGISAEAVHRLAGEIAQLHRSGVQIGLVVGGGNLVRGADKASEGIDRVTADYMGMLATLINALALQDAIEKHQVPVRVMSAISVHQICEDYIRRRAIRHLEKGRVVLFAAGLGNPFFTTDSAASLRAIEVGADLLIKATKVDGVYDRDPMKDPHAKRFVHLSYGEALRRELGVMDTTALVLCRDHGLPIRVLNVFKPKAMLRAIEGEAVGTLISGEERP